MSLIGLADFDRPIDFVSGSLYYAYGGGGFPLVPYRCRVVSAGTGLVDLHLDLIRALDPRQSHAVLSCTFAADYASEDALSRARQVDPNASIVTNVLTDWWFRVLPSATLGAPVELMAPAVVSSDGLGTARFIATLGIDTGLILESMLQSQVPLRGVAEAGFEGVSPRLPIVVRFESTALLQDLLTRADASGALPRRAIVDYFSRKPSQLPLSTDGTIDDLSLPRFAEAMTDRIVNRYGRYVPSQTLDDAPVVELHAVPDFTTVMWALAQPVAAVRRAVLPIDLLSDAQRQVARLGIQSVVQRTNLTSLPPLGQTRVVALCTLPPVRVGVEALGVTLTFPPRLPERPQPVAATALFDVPDDTAVIDVRLSPGEPIHYRYKTFAVVTDDQGTRQIDGTELSAEGSPLNLSSGQFPLDFVVIEVTPALSQIAVVSGVCTYEDIGVTHRQPFTIDSGILSIAIGVPRSRDLLSIDGYAVARDGSGQLRIGPIESPHVKLDLTSFREYGPQELEIRCVFDDGATLQAISILPADRLEGPDTVTPLAFTPTEPVRTFRWFVRTPFAAGLRYRRFDAAQAAWTAIPPGSKFTVYSSELRKQERARVARETIEAGPAAPEAPIDPVAVSPAFDVTDLLIFSGVADGSKKYYVPQYALDVQSVSGQDRYRLSMSQQNGKPTLEVNLVAAPDPSIAEEARSASAYPHRVAVVLDFLVAASSGARKSLEFQEVARSANAVKATLTFDTLAERDDVYRALTDEERDAHLTVQRYFDVRVPSRGGVGPGGIGPRGGGLRFPQLIPRPILFTRPLPIPPTPDPVITPAVLTAAPSAVLTARMAMRAAVERTAPARESAALLAPSPIARTVTMRTVGHFVPSLPVPRLAFTDTQEANGVVRCRVSVTNWADYSDDFFAPSPDLPPCGLNRSASRTWVDIFDADNDTRLYGFCALTTAKQLNELSFALPAGKSLPAHVLVMLTDRRTRVRQRSNAVDTSSQESVIPLPPRDIRIQLDHVVAPSPFAFAPALHGYIFQGITASSSGSNQLIRRQIPWKGTFHTYLQDATRPTVVYVFADAFKIARRPDAPFSPYATVRVTSQPDGSDTNVVFDYVVAPYTDPKRLDDARTQLLADAQFGATSVDFQPFLTTDVRFFIDRPATSGSVREQRTDASVVLQGVLKDTLTMPLADFRLLFDAMYQRTASLFLGHVEIDVPNEPTEAVLFTARMDDLAGDVFTYSITPANGAMQVTARNDIESPLSVQGIDAMMAWNGQRKHAVVTGSGIPAAALAAGAAIDFTVAPDTPWPASAEPQVAFDLGAVRAIPDPDAIWNSILDRTTVEFFTFVTVKALASYFEPVAGRETERIASILVDFEGGATAELNSGALEAKVRVDHSIDDVILRRPGSGTYRYSVTVIRDNGHQDHDATPRETSSTTFFISVVK